MQMVMDHVLNVGRNSLSTRQHTLIVVNYTHTSQYISFGVSLIGGTPSKVTNL